MSEKLSNNGLLPAEDLFYMIGGKERIKILDATFVMPGGQISPYQGFLGRRIEGAQFFDIDVVADPAAPLPHTLPSPEYFASCVESLGISNDDHVVIYDQSGAYMASSRAWWMFRVFGHENVYVLDGGLQAWVGRGFRTVEGPADTPSKGNFKASYNAGLVVSRKDLLNNIETRDITVVDARPASRFLGQSPEPRPGMRAGHIPNSVNLPFGELMDQKSRTLKNENELDEVFKVLRIEDSTKMAVSCGSGVTACTVALALFKARQQNSAVYDGSWAEWGDEDADTPVEVSA